MEYLPDQHHRIRQRCLVGQPVGVVLTPEPGALAFGELAGALAGDSYRICGVQAAEDHLQRFAVADGLQQRQISAVALAQAPGLLPSPSQYSCSVRCWMLAQVGGAGPSSVPPGRRRGCGLAAHRLPGGVEHLQGALGAHRISRGDFGGGLGVSGLQREGVPGRGCQLLAQLLLVPRPEAEGRR